MGLLAYSGAEGINTVLHWMTAEVGDGQIVTTGGLFGGRAFFCGSTNADLVKRLGPNETPPSKAVRDNVCHFGFWFRGDTQGAFFTNRICSAQINGQPQWFLRQEPSGAFDFTGEGGGIIATSDRVSKEHGGRNTWHWLEVFVTINNAPNGTVHLKVDGETWIQETGLDTQDRSTNVWNEWYGMDVGGNGQDHFYDDLFICDGVVEGDVFDDFVGPVRTLWCPMARTTSGGNHTPVPDVGDNKHENVDEVPPDDDSSYVEGQVLGDKQQFGCDIGENLGANDVILATILRNYARKDSDTEPLSWNAVISRSGSDVVVKSRGLTESYVRLGTDPMLVNPITEAAWVKDDLNEWGAETGAVCPESGSLSLAGHAPEILGVNIFAPGAGALGLAGPAPSMIKQLS